MSSSELSNALNPYITQSRSRRSPSQYHLLYEPVLQPPPQQYTPHRSELEFAFAEPPPPAAPQTQVARSRQPTSASVQAVQELLRIVVATRDSQEIERRRRLAWEHEQEEKYAQQHAELEKLIIEMRQEISSLRSNAKTQTHLSSIQSASPISPVSHYPGDVYPSFVQGSSSDPFAGCHTYEDDSQETLQPRQETPAPSPPHLTCVQPSQLHELFSAPASKKRRATSELSSDEENTFSSDGSSSRPAKRANHHDNRCLTIHAALRKHLLRVMEIEDGKDLPDSHIEKVPFPSGSAVRFVWEKTTKQSVHNARMKARVLADLKSNRAMYRHVPEKDFSKKVLEAAFEAIYTTMRQKFKAQRDKSLALHHKQREDAKAQKARHLSRRKLKLSNRSEARMKVDAFSHVAFDSALQLECMSSEESDQEYDDVSPSPGLLVTRGYRWRSTRLLRFYNVLDEEDKATNRPKRGVGRKERCPGPPKDGFHLPPPGVATWMISRRWIKNWQLQYPDLQVVLGKRIQDSAGFDWDQFHGLGEESDSSGDEQPTSDIQDVFYPTTQHSFGGSSLDYTLL